MQHCCLGGCSERAALQVHSFESCAHTRTDVTLVSCMQAAQTPTCADTDPAAAGAQKFVCNADDGLVYDPTSDAEAPSEDSCCLVSVHCSSHNFA
jgi:hypothetical protein